MLPGPTNVPERVTRAMVTPSINHRSDDFVELYEECVDNTKKILVILLMIDLQPIAKTLKKFGLSLFQT